MPTNDKYLVRYANGQDLDAVLNGNADEGWTLVQVMEVTPRNGYDLRIIFTRT